MSAPFQIFSWQRPFLHDLKDYIMKETGGKPGRALVIVPNRRPWRYFEALFAQDGKTIMLPKMLPFSSIAALWRRHCQAAPLAVANMLDMAALAHECVERAAGKDPALAARLAKMEMADFLPWGMRLARLLEDILTQGITAKAIAAPEGDVDEFAARILLSLGAISAEWLRLLPERGFTTTGLDCYIAQANAAKIPPLLRPEPGRPVYIAGFSTLNGAQNKLFHSLWDNGAVVCMHGDSALASGKAVHGACQDQAKWIDKWRAETQLRASAPNHKPEYSFFAAYDGHSQLEKMTGDLRKAEASTAIVLQDNSLLLPVLHHLEDKNVNISMGYPLSRTPINGLLVEIFRLLLRKRPEGKFYWQDLQKIFHHPFIMMLEAGDNCRMRAIVDKIDVFLRNGAKYVDLASLAEMAQERLAPEERRLLSECLKILVVDTGNATSLGQLAAALSGICDLVLRYGANVIEQFPLDEEALARLRDITIPALAQNTLADEQFSLDTLRGILETLTEQERVPFEADPLVGMQILGMLETRLLHFDEVFILDASDDYLPGQAGQDPLLPDNLRGLIGLPDNHTRQVVAAHNLFRLCQSAKKAHFYWTEGAAPSGVDSARKYRSRYVEQLIWDIEQRQGKRLKYGDEPLAAAESQAILHLRQPAPIERSAALDGLTAKLLSGSISASMLNDYIACPLKFAKKRLLRLSPAPAVNEGEDQMLLGDCVHNVLRDLLKPYVGEFAMDKAIREALKENIERCLEKQMEEMEMINKLPINSYLYFKTAAPIILRKYFEKEGNNPDGNIVKMLERSLEAVIAINGKNYKLYGRIDRIDEGENGLLILDYKTGARKKIDKDIWADSALFGAMGRCLDNDEFLLARGDEIAAALREKLQDIQLPFYIILATRNNINAENAAFVYLRKEGEQEWVFGENPIIDKLSRQCEILTGFWLRHLALWPRFDPVIENCSYCDYKQFCGV